MTHPEKVLCVTDDYELAADLAEHLTRLGYDVRPCLNRGGSAMWRVVSYA